MSCALLSDERRVMSITFQEGHGYEKVGLGGVTSIRVESVAGDGAYVPWFTVHKTDGYFRFNARFLECVEYEPGKE